MSGRARSTRAIAPAGKVLYGDAAVTHKKTGPGDPDRNLRILETVKAERPLLPREQFYYARELAAHGREEEAAGQFRQFFGRGPGLGGKREAGLPRPGPVPGPPGQGGGGPGRPAAGALATARPAGSCAARWGTTFWRGASSPPRCSGTRPPSPAPRTAGPGGSSARSTTATTPACSCASAGTAWGTRPWPGPTTAAAAACHPDSAVCRANEAFFASGEARAASLPAR